MSVIKDRIQREGGHVWREVMYVTRLLIEVNFAIHDYRDVFPSL
jgi:hypothetical protein